MKWTARVAFCVVVSVGLLGSAWAIELVDPSKAPSTYVKMTKQGDKTVPVFDTTHHWFSASTFDKIMAAYGCTLSDPKKVPAIGK